MRCAVKCCVFIEIYSEFETFSTSSAPSGHLLPKEKALVCANFKQLDKSKFERMMIPTRHKVTTRAQPPRVVSLVPFLSTQERNAPAGKQIPVLHSTVHEEAESDYEPHINSSMNRDLGTKAGCFRNGNSPPVGLLGDKISKKGHDLGTLGTGGGVPGEETAVTAIDKSHGDRPLEGLSCIGRNHRGIAKLR